MERFHFLGHSLASGPDSDSPMPGLPASRPLPCGRLPRESTCQLAPGSDLPSLLPLLADCAAAGPPSRFPQPAPTGIDFLSFFLQAYLSVAPAVAGFPEYLEPLAWQLLRVKLRHWDKALRELAAQALAGEIRV